MVPGLSLPAPRLHWLWKQKKQTLRASLRGCREHMEGFGMLLSCSNSPDTDGKGPLSSACFSRDPVVECQGALCCLS